MEGRRMSNASVRYLIWLLSIVDLTIGALLGFFLGIVVSARYVNDTPRNMPSEKVLARAFLTPLPRVQDPAATWLLTVPLRVLNVDKDSGIANVETPDGNTFFLLGIRGLPDMERGAYFKIRESIDKDTGVLSREALRVLESDIDFITGLFAEGTDERKEADALLNIGP